MAPNPPGAELPAIRGCRRRSNLQSKRLNSGHILCHVLAVTPEHAPSGIRAISSDDDVRRAVRTWIVVGPWFSRLCVSCAVCHYGVLQAISPKGVSMLKFVMCAIAAILTLMSGAPQARAWGGLGHRAVAVIAMNLIPEKTAKNECGSRAT